MFYCKFATHLLDLISNTALDYYSKRCYNSIGDNNEKENTCRSAYRYYLFGLRPCDKYNPEGGERFSCADL